MRCNYFLLLFMLLNILNKTLQYRTYSVERECVGKKMNVNLTSGDASSAALVKATDRTSYSLSADCSISLLAPNKHSIAVAVKEIGFRMYENKTCKDYLKINNKAMCESLHFSDERHLFYSIGNKMQLLYHVAAQGIDNSTFTGYPGFQITVTAFTLGCPTNDVKESDWFLCDNGQCIWSNLRCDSHNNCGDLSDEENCTTGSGSGSTALIVLGVLILLLMLIMCVATLLCSKNENIRRIRTRTLSYLRRFSK